MQSCISFLLVICCITISIISSCCSVTIESGVIWNDTSGTSIQAHGGGIVRFNSLMVGFIMIACSK